MAIATHLGPWLLGTVKNTTGTTAGTIRNTGATQVTQTITIPFASINASLTGTAFVLPAGSIIHDFRFFTTETFADSTPTAIATTVKLTIGATDVTAATTVTGPANPANMTGATASNAVTSLFANVGSTDAIVTYTATKAAGTYATGSVTLQVTYTVRNSDGTFQPTAFTA